MAYNIRVLIPCYTESLDIVATVVLAAADAMLPAQCRRTVYLLDDGKDKAKAAWVAAQVPRCEPSNAEQERIPQGLGCLICLHRREQESLGCRTATPGGAVAGGPEQGDGHAEQGSFLAVRDALAHGLGSKPSLQELARVLQAGLPFPALAGRRRDRAHSACACAPRACLLAPTCCSADLQPCHPTVAGPPMALASSVTGARAPLQSALTGDCSMALAGKHRRWVQ